jgi:hypothetical protein
MVVSEAAFKTRSVHLRKTKLLPSDDDSNNDFSRTPWVNETNGSTKVTALSVMHPTLSFVSLFHKILEFTLVP